METKDYWRFEDVTELLRCIALQKHQDMGIEYSGMRAVCVGYPTTKLWIERQRLWERLKSRQETDLVGLHGALSAYAGSSFDIINRTPGTTNQPESMAASSSHNSLIQEDRQQLEGWYGNAAAQTEEDLIVYRGFPSHDQPVSEHPLPNRFISATWSPFEALDFASGKCGKWRWSTGANIFEIHVPAGTPICAFQFDGRPSEGEFLLPPTTRWKVTERRLHAPKSSESSGFYRVKIV